MGQQQEGATHDALPGKVTASAIDWPAGDGQRHIRFHALSFNSPSGRGQGEMPQACHGTIQRLRYAAMAGKPV